MYRFFVFAGVMLAIVAAISLANGPALQAQSIATSTPTPATAATPGVASPIQHIVILVKENRSFDNYFGTFPGADGATFARRSNGKLVRLGHTPDHTLLDLAHAGDAARVAVANGRMNGFDQLPGAIQDGRDIALSQLEQSDIPNYWSYDSPYTLADHFFPTIKGP